MELIDTSIVNVALNNMAGNLGCTIEDISWVITAYAIANVIIIPMTSFLAAYFGRKNYYLYSIVIFTAASFMCGNSTTLWEIVLWRFVQGIGGGALLSTSQSILFDTFTVEQRGTASAIFGMGIVVGPTLGPTVGGLLIDNYSWPLIFNINIPFGILAAVLTYFFIEDSVHHTEKPAIDWGGILLLAVGVGSLQYVLERGQTNDWFENEGIRIFAVLAAIGVIGFVLWELRQKQPVVNLRLLKDSNLTITTMLTFISGVSLYTSVFIYPLLLQRVLGYTPTMVGMSLIPGALGSLIIMPIVGRRLQAGDSPKPYIAVGFSILIIYGILLYYASNINSSIGDYTLPLIVRSVGISMAMVCLTNQAVAGLKPRDIPQLGGAFGIAFMNIYVDQRYAVHRNELISYITPGAANFVARNNALLGVGSKLAVSANAQQTAYKLLDLAVDRQAYLLTYLDGFLFSVLFIVAVFPLIPFLKTKKLDAATQKAVAESSH
jgi:DHA2 family multidrug resistance protein